ncbi:unnamed protein product [Brachionus calyciflorus]|uniref:G-protein coupled receptors family 1 profile domain-containing protein n=1 Tax=Brachionus calyciflorus TaxID=104777 RepID=A0A814IIP7_9BILA|nr:unnamed protein product [Brachionus calyciflorus]
MNSNILMDVNPYWKQFDPVRKEWFMVIAFICIIIDILGILANSLVLFYLIKKKSRKISNGCFFIINLAISDLLNLLINIPIKAMSNLNQAWFLNKTICQMYGFLGGLFGFVSITTMALMSIERFLIVKNPLNALKLNEKIMLSCSLFSWIYSTFWISLGFLTSRGFDLEGILTSCTIDYLSRDLVTRITLIFLFIGGFIIPFVIIVFCYCLILSILKLKNGILQYNFSSNNLMKHDVRMSSLFLPNDNLRYMSNASLNENSKFIVNKLDKYSYQTECREIFEVNKKICKTYPKINLMKKNNYFLKREIQVSKTILMSVGFFCMSWFPYAIVLLVAQFGSNRESFITPLSASLPALFAKFSTVANPIVYTLHHKECRLYFLEILKIRKATICSFFVKK